MASDVSVSAKSDSYERFLAKTKDLHGQLSTVLKENKATLESLNPVYAGLATNVERYASALGLLKRSAQAGLVTNQSYIAAQSAGSVSVGRLTSNLGSQNEVLNKSVGITRSAIDAQRGYISVQQDNIFVSSAMNKSISEGLDLRKKIISVEEMQARFEERRKKAKTSVQDTQDKIHGAAIEANKKFDRARQLAASREEMKAAKELERAARAEEKAAEKLDKENAADRKKAGNGILGMVKAVFGHGPFSFDEVISMDSPLSLLKYIWDVLKSIYKWLEKLDIGKWFDDLWNNIKNWTASLWNTLENWLTSLKNSVVTAIDNLGKWIGAVGPSILSGLELGLAGALSALGLGAVADLLRQLVEQDQAKKLGGRSTPRTRVVTESIVSGPQPQASPLAVTDPNSVTLGPVFNSPLGQSAFNPIPTSGSQGSPVRITPTFTTQDKVMIGASVVASLLNLIKGIAPTFENTVLPDLGQLFNALAASASSKPMNMKQMFPAHATGGFHIREHLGIVGDVPEVTLPLNSASSKPAFDSIAQSIMKAGGSGMGNGDVHIHVGENSVNLMDNFTTDIFVRKIMERIQLIQGNTGQFNYNRI